MYLWHFSQHIDTKLWSSAGVKDDVISACDRLHNSYDLRISVASLQVAHAAEGGVILLRISR